MTTTVTEPIALDKTLQALVDSYNRANSNDVIVDGTVDGYRKAMYKWFIAKGALTATAAQLTALCDEWYTVTRQGWNGWVEFPLTGNSYGTRCGDLEGIVVEPSTNATAGQDDLAGNPLFATVDCNWTVDSTTYEPVITAIEGITPNFKRHDPTVYVGVLQMSGYVYQYFDSNNEYFGYCDGIKCHSGMQLVKEARRPDGTMRPWVVHAKYMSGIYSTNPTCCSGMGINAWMSHNGLQTFAKKAGNQYSGGTIVDWTWLEIMHRIVYACLASDPINAGCLNYNITAYAQVAETGVKRILCTPSAVTNIEVGSSVFVGAVPSNNTADRGNSSCYSISGNTGAVVTAKESVTVNGVTYTALYVDADSTFDTVVNGNATAGTTCVMTWHWPTGSCDKVLGHNGSIAANTGGKYPALLQGIEYGVGAYEVFADCIANWILRDGHNVCEFMVVDSVANQSTSVTANYEKAGEVVPGDGSNAWLYISRMLLNDGVMTWNELDGSSSLFERDQLYVYRDGSTTGTREVLAFCSLAGGVALGGLSAANLNNALSLAGWLFAGRISPNGTRG